MILDFTELVNSGEFCLIKYEPAVGLDREQAAGDCIKSNLNPQLTATVMSHLMKRRRIFFTMTRTFKVRNAILLIVRRSFFFTALQFVAITCYTVSLRLAKKKQQRTLYTAQLRILGSITNFIYWHE